ncbi:MCE family protein [Nocardia sp. NPDC005366]|uniref:MCE family protein n=1 Tax=Nocardia sp. NPDC005366 TaxID=3156878 RepID=UPI0033A20686
MTDEPTPSRRARRPALVWLASAVAVAVLAAVSYGVAPRLTSTTVTAEFVAATGLYPGDDVRVMGVTVGSIEHIEPAGDKVLVRMRIDADQPVPADAKAVIMSPNLVSSRFVQLAPAYTGGPRLSSEATIPIGRTAVPVEWDQIKTQLRRLVDALGPTSADPRGPLGQVIDTAATNLRDQGPTLHQTLIHLSEAMRTLSDGRGDLMSIITNLQIFVTALSESGQQIVAINNRLASVTTLLADNRADIGTALTRLDDALGQVNRFVTDNHDRLTGTAESLSEVVATLAQQRDGIAQVLHVAPTALANLQNIYQPAHNSVVSALALSNFANPVNFLCSAIAAAEDSDAERGAELCAHYLGPLLSLLSVDYLPLTLNPSRGVGALPGQLVYSTPDLAPAATVEPSSRPLLEQLLLPGGPR